jgi:hypothetical protein
MAIDDGAGRKAVRERRVARTDSESVFVYVPRHSARIPTLSVALREDVHQRGLAAAKRELRSYRTAKRQRGDD